MIYLITGIPGSGKTLYAVAKLIPELVKQSITTEDGKTVQRRLLVDGIPGLTIEHSPMAPSKATDRDIVTEDGHGFGNWWTWCQPGDILVVDEVQRLARPRAIGMKPPMAITELETHRHYGIDLVIITQNPTLLDQNIRRLVGRHQHVRRMFGGSRSIIYDWDGCQVDTTRLRNATKSFFKYPKQAFSQYKSAELHTKQNQKIPAWLAVPLLAIAGIAIMGPQAYAVISKGTSGQTITAQNGKDKPAPNAAPLAKPSSAPAPASGAVSALIPITPSAPVPPPPNAVAGCAVSPKGVCKCYNEAGAYLPNDTSDAMCFRGAESPIKTGNDLAKIFGPDPMRDYDPNYDGEVMRKLTGTPTPVQIAGRSLSKKSGMLE